MSTYSIIMLVGAMQGLLLVAGLSARNWNKAKQNWYFYSLLLLLSVALLSKALYTSASFEAYPHLWYILDLIAFTVGPLWYFTVRQALEATIKWDPIYGFFFFPILFYVGFIAFLFILPREELLVAPYDPWYYWGFLGFCLVAIWVNFGFIWRAHRLVKSVRNVHFPPLLKHLQWAFLAVLGVWFGSFVLSVIVFQLQIPVRFYHYAFLGFSILILTLAMAAYVRPSAFQFITEVYDNKEQLRLEELASAISAHLPEEKPYLNKSFSLGELASAVAANPVLTSKAINRILGLSFSDLINRYRIQYFLEQTQRPEAEQLTLWALAQEAGFGNKATFYQAFRKEKGTTPKAYLKEIQKEV